MTNHIPPSKDPDPLDDVVDQLLQCGGVLSQMIAGMVKFEASGRSAPGTAPIPEVAHELIRSVSLDVARRHSRRDMKTAAKIVREITDSICNDIYAIPLDECSLDECSLDELALDELALDELSLDELDRIKSEAPDADIGSSASD